MWICEFFKFIVIETIVCNFWDYKPAEIGKWPQKKGMEALPDLLRLGNSLNNAKKKKKHVTESCVSRHTRKLIAGKNMATIHENQELVPT